MRQASDGIPEPVETSERSKRTTTEFCNDLVEGYRCMLIKGHTGMHECLATDGVARWPTCESHVP